MASRPPLTHTFRRCPPSRASTPASFRPCRFSRLRRLAPSPAFRHVSVGNAYGVTTLQSILSDHRLRREMDHSSLPAVHRGDATGACTRSPLVSCAASRATRTGDSGGIHDRELFPPGTALAGPGARSSHGLRSEGTYGEPPVPAGSTASVESRSALLGRSPSATPLQGSSLSADPRSNRSSTRGLQKPDRPKPAWLELSPPPSSRLATTVRCGDSVTCLRCVHLQRPRSLPPQRCRDGAPLV